MTTVALIFFAYLVVQALAVVVACALVNRKMKRHNPFVPEREFTYLCSCGRRHLVGDVCDRYELNRAQLAKTLRRIHP